LLTLSLINELATFVGAFANHNMYVVIHEATHNLIFKSRLANRWVVILADLANAIPGGNSWWRKSLWLLFFPVFQIGRAYRVENVNTFTKWVLINIACAVVVDIAMIYFFGWNAIVYMVGSMFFSLGLHPLGARWVQEHYTLDGAQETHSYYGPLNNISMNIGYHVEHHDFPAIPWTNIKKLKAMAPEYYDNLRSHDSWFSLWLQFIFNPKYSLFSRVTRENGKNKVVVEIGKSSKQNAAVFSGN